MILHVDMDAFYASVELRDNPKLTGKPVVVGGSPSGRGVVSAASYEARKFGVHSAMPAAQAIRICPNAVFLKPQMEKYAAISKQIREIFFRYTSLVEPLSLDEAFLDVTGSQRLFGEGPSIAKQIKQTIWDELNLVASVGVAPNKYLAKIASDLEKPDGLVIVPADQVDSFLAPLEITRIWGVGPQMAKKFQSLGVRTNGQLKKLTRETLKRTFGVNGDHFWRLARGLDSRLVVPDRIAKSVSHETTFANDISDDDALLAWLLELAEQVGRRLRRHEIFGKTVQIKVRYSDFRTITRSKTLPARSQTTQTLWEAGERLLQVVRQENQRPVRLLGFGVSNLSGDAKRQKNLFDQQDAAKATRMDDAADSIRDRFGSSAVKRASSIQHNINYRREPRVNDPTD